VIAFGHDSGTNSHSGGRIDGLNIDLPLNGADDGIFELNGSGTTPPVIPSVLMLIQGKLAYCTFKNIVAGSVVNAFSYLFYADPAHTSGDDGRCVYEDCSIIAPSGGIFNYTPSVNSQMLGLTLTPAYGVGITGYWLLVTGYWLLVTGYWLLVTGY